MIQEATAEEVQMETVAYIPIVHNGHVLCFCSWNSCDF